jgi:glycosyltransferase involved in cell wall biosynthesis
MRVLHIDNGKLFGGVETILTTIARSRELTPDVEPEFAVCFEARLSRELAAAGAPLHILGEVRIRRPLTLMRARRRLREILSAGGYDAVVCHMAWTQALFGSVARASRVPIAMWQHMASNRRDWLEQLARMAGPDLVICNSQFTATEFRGAYPSLPAEVVYCPVAAPSTSYSRADRDAARSELTTPAQAVVIVHTGRMQEWKGQRLLMQAASTIKSNSQWVIWFVGGAQRESEQRYLASLHAGAAELGIEDRVRFAGQRGDVERLLAASDIHCQPNISPEPFGIALVEALYAGIPVVTTKMGGAIEILNDSCGIMVPPNDPGALAVALDKLVVDGETRRRLGNAGPARALELCDPRQQMELLRKTLLNLCDSRRPVASHAQ